MLMRRLGLDICDIGFIADKLLEIECDEPATAEPTDDVLDAKELNL